MKNIILLVFFAFFISDELIAQKNLSISCGSDEIHLENLKSSDQYKDRFQNSNKNWGHFARNYESIMSSRTRSAELTTLNLVLHDISASNTFLPTPSGTMDDYSYITESLNTVFSGTSLNGGLGNETNIRFCLARQDVNNDTYTIDDLQVENEPLADGLSSSNFSDILDLTIAVETSEHFPTEFFTNIYIVDSIEDVAGFAFLPSSHGSPSDGIYIQRSFLINDATLSDNIVVLVHEIGHYLGLFHTFGICDPDNPIEEICSCTNDNCLFDGDMVCDTPPNISQVEDYTCDTPPNTCVDNLIPTITDGSHPTTEVPDQKENYMDYGFSNCKFLFSQGQIMRMCFMIDPEFGPRKSLLGQAACINCEMIDECNYFIVNELMNDVQEVNTSSTFSMNVEDCIIGPAPIMEYEWQLTNLTTGNDLGSFTGETITLSPNLVGNYKLVVLAALSTNTECVEEICYEFQVVPESVAEDCLRFRTIDNWDNWDRVSYTGGWALEPTYNDTWDPTTADPGDYAHASTQRFIDDVSVSPNFEVVENLDDDVNFNFIALPDNVSNFLRVGPQINGTEPLVDGAANYVSMTFNPTAENSRYEVHFIGATANLNNFSTRPEHLFNDANYRTSFGWFCNYNYVSPLDPSDAVRDIGSYENNTNGLLKHTDNDFIMGNIDVRYPNRINILPIPEQTIGDTNYKLMDGWSSVILDFSEFVDDPNSSTDADLSSTEVTITFFSRTNNALGANLHSYAYFGIECLGGGLPQHLDLEYDDLVIACQEETGESCIVTETNLVSNIGVSAYSFSNVDIEESLDGVTFGPTTDATFIANNTLLGIVGFRYRICLDDEDPPNKFYRVAVNTMHHTVEDTFQIIKGYFYNDPICNETSTNDFIGGDAINGNNVFICEDSDPATLVLSDPCFDDANYNFSWWNLGYPIPGETGATLDYNPNLLSSRTCKTTVIRRVEFTDPYCGTTDTYQSEIFNVYNLNGYSVIIEDNEPLQDACFGDPIIISIDGIIRDAGCGDDAFEDFIEENGLDVMPGSFTFTLAIDGIEQETITVDYLDGIYSEGQNVVFSPIVNLAVGDHDISYEVTSNFNGCDNTSVFVVNDSDLSINIAPISLGGDIELLTNCNPINLNSLDDGNSSEGIYEWEYAYTADFSGTVEVLMDETSPSVMDLDPSVFSSFPVFLRRVSTPFPNSFGCEDNVVKYSNVIELEACNDCVTCVHAYEEVYGNLIPTEVCGEYVISVPTEILECYSVEFEWLENIGLDDEPYTFTYTSNGSYSVAISIIDLETGKVCYKEKFDLIVDCFDECIECSEAFIEIAENVISTETCGEYMVTVPISILECYSVTLSWTDNVSLTDEPYTFAYSSNGIYTIGFSLYDLVTGKKCYEEKFDLIVDCFDECIECSEAFIEIAENVISTETCGEYKVTVPISILECYSVTLSWTDNVSLTDEPYTFSYSSNGIYTIGFSLYDLVTGKKCYEEKFDLIVDCFDECISCTDAFNEVYSNLSATEECGEYLISVPTSILECYSVVFEWTESVVLTDEPYTFGYTSNGTYSVVLGIYDLITGEQCLEKDFTLTVDCFGECISCTDAFNEVYSNLSATEECGEYVISVPTSILECYSVVFEWTESVVLTDEPYTLGYSSNGSYSLVLGIYDLTTGVKCLEKDFTLIVDCFENICIDDPFAEELLTDHLKNILNAILEYQNGFTGSCVSGSTSTWVNISSMPEVIDFMDEYNLEVRLQNALDIRAALGGLSYTADIDNVYYKWGVPIEGNNPCLTIEFTNGVIGEESRFYYTISGGSDDFGVPISEGLNPELIEEFTNIELNVSESKATVEYTDVDGVNQSIYDILWPTIVIDGTTVSALKYCWFHDLDYNPAFEEDIDESGIEIESVILNIDDNFEQKEIDINVVPNPARERITITTNDHVIEEVQFYKSSGGVLKALTGLNQKSVDIEVDSYPRGLYFARIQLSNNEFYYKRVILY